MTLSDFQIGKAFKIPGQSIPFVCTDIGSRVVVAMSDYAVDHPEAFAEFVFNEKNQALCVAAPEVDEQRTEGSLRAS